MPVDKHCIECGVLMKQVGNKKKYCSRKCLNNYVLKNPEQFQSVEQLKCDFCGKQFNRIKKKIKAPGHANFKTGEFSGVYCTHECYSKDLSRRQEVKHNHNKVHLNCLQCKKEITKTQSHIKKYKRFFCSKKCHMLYQNAHDELHSKNPFSTKFRTDEERKAIKKINDRNYRAKNVEKIRVSRAAWAREKTWKEKYPEEFREVAKLKYQLEKKLKEKNNEQENRK